jgi:chaperone required for assembly of F1-ATPase
MCDRNDGHPPDGAAAAARRAMRPALRRRFYDKVGTVSDAGGYAVRLDGKPVRTPAGRILAAPSAALAQALAAEWDAQRDLIDPARMPLTRLANSIIDGVSDRPDPVAAEVEKYLASDLICYPAAAPSGLVERQARHWEPILAWARETLGAPLRTAPGVVHIAQDEEALARARGVIPREPWRLGAINAATTLTGSALIAIALARGRLSVEEAWQAAHVDEDWNMEQWGRDEVALERRAFRFAEFDAAAKVLRLL